MLACYYLFKIVCHSYSPSYRLPVIQPQFLLSIDKKRMEEPLTSIKEVAVFPNATISARVVKGPLVKMVTLEP